MKESIKKKLDSIDQSKISVKETRDYLIKIEKALNNDKNEENQAKAEKLLEVFISKAKAKNADIFKTEAPVKPKTPAQKKQVAQSTKTKLDSLMDTIANDPLFKDFNSARRIKGGGKSDPLIDSERKARESGRRVSQKGWSNQYGKSLGGRRYYEYRENRIDRKAPNYGTKPWLEDGGLIHPSDKFQEKYSVIEMKEDGSRKVHNTFPDFETAMVFASLKRNVMPSNTQIVIEDEKGTKMYRSFMDGGMLAKGGMIKGDTLENVRKDAKTFSRNSKEDVYVLEEKRLEFLNGNDKSVVTQFTTATQEDVDYIKAMVHNRLVVSFKILGKYSNGELKSSEQEVLFVNRSIMANGGMMADGGLVEIKDGGMMPNEGKYYVIDAKDGKILSQGFDTEEEAKVEKYKIFENKGIFSLTQKKMAKGGMMADGGEMGQDKKRIYFSSFAEVMEAINDVAQDNGYEIKEIFPDLSFGGVSYGQTKRAQVELEWNGKDKRGLSKKREKNTLNVQIYRMESGNYELNSYFSYAEGGMMDDGGYIAKGENYEYVNTFKRFDSNVPVPQEDFEKLVDAYHKQLSGDKLAVSKYKVLKLQMGNYLGHKTIEEMESYIEKTHNYHKMAKGGMMAKGGKVKWQDVFVGDKALVIEENKMGYVMKTYGRRFHLKFPDGSEKTYSAEELEFFKDEEYAKGGKTQTGDYTNRRDLKLIIIKNPNKNGSKNFLTIDKADFLNGLYKFEEGGNLSKEYTYVKRADVNQVVYRDNNNKETIDSKPKNGFWVSKKALADAGMNETKANFDKNEVANKLTELSNEAWNKLSIQSGSEIYASDKLQQDLSDEYQKLGINKIYKQLTKAEKKKVSDVLTDKNEHSLRNFLALRGYNGEAEYKNYVKMFEEGKVKFGYSTNWNPKNVDFSNGAFAKGGELGFEGLSKKVAKNYENKKVPDKFQKEYGKTYDKAEAKEVGDKVASKVYRGQVKKMESGGKLPEELDRYFIKTPQTKMVKMSSLKPSRSRPEGIANAEKYMKMAYDGQMDKRKPISIYKSHGMYKVSDGNSTYAVAKANGWENIYAEIIKNPNMNTYNKRTNDIFTKAKEIRKEGEAWQDAVKRATAISKK